MASLTKTKQTSFNACMTGVNPQRTHGLGVYKGRRVVWGVRVDEKLLKQAKPLLRAKFGSDCRGVEAWLAALVAANGDFGKSTKLGVNPSNTVKIGKIVIERNLRSRRKLVVEEETEVSETEAVSCGFCNKAAVAVYDDGKMQKYACEFHGNLLKAHPKWRLVEAVSVGV